MINGLKAIVCVACGLLVVAGGCDELSLNWLDDDDTIVASEPDVQEFPPHVANTVAQHAGLLGAGHMGVKGYGVVISLGKNGSAEIPPHLQEYLVEYMQKNLVGLHSAGTDDLPPMRILRDYDTAVVSVEGGIPPAAPEDTRFDVTVTALSGTGTRSLEGGVLVATELRLDTGQNDPGRLSKVWAMAGGPVLINPYVDPTDSQQQAQLRQGVIVGGGKVVRPLRISLQLYRPDYAIASAIMDRINQRFPGFDRVAVAKNASLVELKIPPEAEHDYEHFLRVILHLPMQVGPAVGEAHCRRLIAEMEKPDANHNRLALVLEGHGASVIPMLGALYESPLEGAAFYTARTGLRLGDRAAEDVILAFASRAGSPLQTAAIDLLGRHRRVLRSEGVLTALLDDSNNVVRYAAYEALRRRGSMAIVTLNVADQFEIDIVPSTQTPLVYAARSERPRIVLFGNDLSLGSPLFFNMPGDVVTMRAPDESPTISIWRRLPGREIYSDTFDVSFDVAEVIRTLGDRPQRNLDGGFDGLGLTYGQVVTILRRLCDEGHIPAEFILETPPAQRRLIQRAREAETRQVEAESLPTTDT